jgi:prepilin-type N-terminal cleavage/methylation domain-containing protein
MNYKLRTNKAFTLIELLVAIGILAMVLSFASVIFKVSINAQRTAIANIEIMQKLRAITNQLNADFKGLRKDGEIFVTWSAMPVPAAGYQDNDLDGYERFDRIMFFADGDFYSYRVNPMVRGNIARVTYILAKRDGIAAQGQARAERMLVRTQHILTDDPALAVFLDPDNFNDQQWYEWNNRYEYEKTSLAAWKAIPFVNKMDMLSVISDIRAQNSNINEQIRGAAVDPADPNSIHMLLCEGVGEFKIQGWNDARQRWIPEVDPDGDGTLIDTDFIPAQNGIELHSEEIPGVLYPYRSWYDTSIDPNSYVQINNISYPGQMLNQTYFNEIPGLGRSLKFTFTLFDSKGIIKEGRTFTHIVYLGN